MIHTKFDFKICAIGLVACLFFALSAHAANCSIVKWRVVGTISGQSSPFTTAAYFPRPLVAGELVTMTFTVNTCQPIGSGSYAGYENAITSFKVAGSDWSLPIRSPLQRGAIVKTNDDPDYGDSLELSANTALIPGSTWYSVDVSMRNPGGPSPGVGPWQPFTNLALPTVPPALGFFPNALFYIQARRDQPGQALDGGSYWGQILSFTLDKRDEH